MKIIIAKVLSGHYLTSGGAWSPDKRQARLFDESAGFEALKIFRCRGESVTFEPIKDLKQYNAEMNRLKSVKLLVKREVRDKKKMVELTETKSEMKKAGKLDENNKPIVYSERKELKLKQRAGKNDPEDDDFGYTAGLGADEFNIRIGNCHD